MKKQIFSLLTALCVLVGLIVPGTVLAADATASEDIKTLLTEEFNYTLDETINGKGSWSVQNVNTTGGSTALIKSNPSDSNDKVLDIESLTTQYTAANKYAQLGANVYTTAGAANREDYLMISKDVMFTSNENTYIFYVSGRVRNTSDDSQSSQTVVDTLVQLSYDLSAGTLSCYSDGSWTEGMPVDIPLNEWIDVDIIVDTEAQTHDVYMNGVKVNASSMPLGVQTEGKRVVGVRYITLGANKWNSASNHMYVDDITVKAFNNLNAVVLPMAQNRLAKMENELTAYTLTGQKYVTKDFTPALSYLQSDDTVEITCADSAFSYNADENKVIITQGTEDKIADVKVKVTSTAGNNIEKDLKVYIPSVSDINREGYFSHSSLVGQSIVGNDNWNFDSTKGEINSDGSTFKVVTSPDDSTDLVLDINVTKQFSKNNNPYIEWNKTTETDGNTVLQANFKFDNDAENEWHWNINGTIGTARYTLVELTFNRKTNKIVAGTSAGAVNVSEVALPTNQWFNVKLVLNSTAQTYDVYVDNVKVNSATVGFKQVAEGQLVNIRQMYFGAYRGTYDAGHMYIDDIIIRDVKPAYEIVGLTFEGSVATLAVTKYTEENIANAMAFVAVYDNETGKLIKASTPVAVNSTGDVTIEGMELPANSKACGFIWKMDTLVPLATMFEN